MSSSVRLRDVSRADLPLMFEFQLDPDFNQMAMTKPRNAEVFAAHWERILGNPKSNAKAIVINDELAGVMSCFEMNGLDVVGSWIGREFWGREIATRALELLLSEVSIRPLHARVATSNAGSLRVLQKCGFVIERVQLSPEDDRYPECEEAILILNVEP